MPVRFSLRRDPFDQASGTPCSGDTVPQRKKGASAPEGRREMPQNCFLLQPGCCSCGDNFCRFQTSHVRAVNFYCGNYGFSSTGNRAYPGNRRACASMRYDPGGQLIVENKQSRILNLTLPSRWLAPYERHNLAQPGEGWKPVEVSKRLRSRRFCRDSRSPRLSVVLAALQRLELFECARPIRSQ